METKEYFEKIMQDYNQHRNGRNLRKYCSDEGVDYKWLVEYKKTYGASPSSRQESTSDSSSSFIPLQVIEERSSNSAQNFRESGWLIKQLVLSGPGCGDVEIRSTNLAAVLELLRKLLS